MLAMYSIHFLLLFVSHSSLEVWSWVMLPPDFSGSGYESGYGSGSGEFGSGEMIIPSRLQQSYPLHGLVCFPDGLRLPCECDNPKCPCCRDWLTGDCYRPTFYRWSEWLPCLDCNDLCDETQECRIKYDEVGPPPYLMYSDRKKRGLPSGMPDIDMHPFLDWMKGPGKHRCQVQRMECRIRLFGTWSDWAVSTCSEECGKGTKMATRMCLDEDGNDMGAENCIGGSDAAVETRDCNKDLCKTIGEWTVEGDCWVYDGDCVENVTRQCLEGPDLTPECSMKKQPCSNEDCSFGVWGNWVPITDCDGTCSPGMQTFHRNCTDENGQFIDYSECAGGLEASSKLDACNEDFCVSYSDYSNVGDCTAECNGGTVNQVKTCDTPGTNSSWVPPAECTDRTIACNTQPCVALTQWTEYSPCSTSCSPGSQTRTRHCVINGTSTPASGCNPSEAVKQDLQCGQGLCTSYTDYTTDGTCEGSLDSCQSPQATASRTCSTDEEVPDGCLTGTGSCDPGPANVKDILIIVNVGKDVDANVCDSGRPYPYIYPNEFLNDTDLFPNFISLQNFLNEFICKFNNISETETRIAISKSQQKTTCLDMVKHFNDTDQTTAINQLSVLCEPLKLSRTLQCSQKIFESEEGERASAPDIILFILPMVTTNVIMDLQLVVETIPAAFQGLVSGKVFAVLSADINIDESGENWGKDLACLEDGRISCDWYLGTTQTDVSEVITKLLALMPKF